MANAGILAASIIGAFDETVGQKLIAYKKTLEENVMTAVKRVQHDWKNDFDKK
jgi:5-(carboxyamino)imidazole ribonucleotide mutase